MRVSVPALFGSTIELLGAFVIGGVLHQTLVRGAFPVTAPASVFGILGGLALILVGRRLERRFEPSEYVPAAEDEEDDEEFDEELSPVPTERLEEREADESVEEG